MTSGDEMNALVNAIWPLPSVAWAVIVQEVGVKGAVKIPDVEIVPQVEALVALLLVANC
jgi:hypothetical protein